MVGTENGSSLVWVAGLTFFFEALTLLLRFKFGLRAERNTTFIKRVTFGLRIHHGYLGLILLILGFVLVSNSMSAWVQRIGASLLLSDIIHHFAILWPLTGSPQFRLTYPKGREE